MTNVLKQAIETPMKK